MALREHVLVEELIELLLLRYVTPYRCHVNTLLVVLIIGRGSGRDDVEAVDEAEGLVGCSGN